MKFNRKTIISIFLMFLFGGSIFLTAADVLLRKEQKVEIEIVVMETSMGTIEIELNRKNAPITVANFVNYVEEGYFDGVVFHRIIKGFMIQGGGFDAAGEYKETRDPIVIESQHFTELTQLLKSCFTLSALLAILKMLLVIRV